MANYVEFYQVTKTFPDADRAAGDRRGLQPQHRRGRVRDADRSLLGLRQEYGPQHVFGADSGHQRRGIAVALREIDGPGPDRGMVFQSPCLLAVAHSAWKCPAGCRPGVSRCELARSGTTLPLTNLELVGLGYALDRSVKQLSQGMQQRVGIARAFATAPKMLLLDEPFGMLDSLTRMELQEVLLELLARDRKTTLMVTHDVDEATVPLRPDRDDATDGPKARVGGILARNFPRPRIRQEVLDSADYYTSAKS